MGKVMTGSRAVVKVFNPNVAGGSNQGGDTQGKIISIFNSCSWGLNYGAADIFVLGSDAPVEIEYTHQEAVTVTCHGWRVIGNGAHRAAGVPDLASLMTHEYITISIHDRKTGKKMGQIRNVRPLGYGVSVDARGVTQISVSFRGIYVDESDTQSAPNSEAASSTARDFQSQ